MHDRDSVPMAIQRQETQPPDPADQASPRLEEDPAGVAEPPLAKEALRGVAWNWGGSVLLIVAQISSTAATARLVSPRQFGLYAAAIAISGIAGYLTLNGIGPGIQRRSKLGEKTVGTAIVISVAAGSVVAALIWVTASILAGAWGVPDATWVIRAIAVSILLTSWSVIPLSLLRRGLRFRAAATIETSAVVLGLGAGVALAASFHNAVALAVGQAVGAGIILIATSLMTRRELGLAFERADASELFRFSTQVSGLNFLLFLNYAAPNWFVARSFGAASLGVYSRANLVVGLPADYALTSIFKVIYPMYGRIREDLGRVKALIDEAVTLTTGLLWPALGLIAGAAPVIVAVLLGDRWGDAAPLITLFALLFAAWVPTGVLTNAAEALGWMRIIAMRQTALISGVIVAMLVTHFADLSVHWLLAGTATAEWLTYFLTLRNFAQREMVEARATLGRQLVHAGIALAAFGATAVTADALGGASLALQVLAQAAIGAVVLAVIASGRSWIPAMQVLARRMELGPDRGLVRAAWSALR
jgi:lipopolysaccharide exporter